MRPSPPSCDGCGCGTGAGGAAELWGCGVVVLWGWERAWQTIDIRWKKKEKHGLGCWVAT
jgi:hypothetical protein